MRKIRISFYSSPARMNNSILTKQVFNFFRSKKTKRDYGGNYGRKKKSFKDITSKIKIKDSKKHQN